MGLARVSLAQAKEVPNHIMIRFQNGKVQGLGIHCTVFPLFCDYCQRSQTDLFLHLGSRYGQVGSTLCQYCGHSIAVVDHDNLVDGVNVNGEYCSFEKLYLLGPEYIEWLEEWCGNVLDRPKEPNHWTDWMTIDQLRVQMERITGIQTDERARYRTDSRFHPLPADINRWIHLLDQSTVPLPSNVERIGE